MLKIEVHLVHIVTTICVKILLTSEGIGCYPVQVLLCFNFYQF